MMDANARMGRRRDGCSDTKVLGVCGRDILNGNGEQLLDLAWNNKLSVTNTFFTTRKSGALHTFQQANSWREQRRLEYMVVQQRT